MGNLLGELDGLYRGHGPSIPEQCHGRHLERARLAGSHVCFNPYLMPAHVVSWAKNLLLDETHC